MRKIPTLGDKPADVATGLEKVKTSAARRPSVATYTVAVGTNTVRHGQNGVPEGRYIIWSECGVITDVSITQTEWTFSSLAAGDIKVIWL